MSLSHKIHTIRDIIINRPHTILGVLFGKISKTGIFNGLSDKTYVCLQYRLMIGRKLNIKSPETFNEKLQWLKLYNRTPLLTKMVDKYGVREIIEEKIGGEFLIPLLGVYHSPDEIDFNKLPKEFVLKCNHDSGSVFICKDKSLMDFPKVKKALARCLKKNQFWWSREWPYKDVKPCIIAEKYMKDEGNENLPVYKFMCFDGEPRIIQVIQNDKQEDESIDYFDINWNLLELRQDYPNSKNHYSRPVQLDKMLEIVKVLAEGMPFVRIDLYLINGKIYF